MAQSVCGPEAAPGLVVGVLPDVPAIDRLLDYLVPARWVGQVGVGTVVRIPLQGRRVRGWVMVTARTAPAGVVLREITKVVGPGPDPSLIELAAWAAQRWAGRRLHFLRAATPLPSHSLAVGDLSRSSPATPSVPIEPDEGFELAHQALYQMEQAVPADPASPAHVGATGEEAAGWVRVLRWPPGRTRAGIALAAMQRGPCLLLTPSQHDADLLERALRSAGQTVGRHPRHWSAGARGASVVGSRAAAWSAVAGLRTIVVFDEHDERYQDERTPTWNARDVAIERGRRAGAAVLLVSPTPSPEAVCRAPALTPSRSVERAGWPQLTVIDRRDLDPREGLYPAALVEELRSGGRTVVVFNRTGRARLLACTRCGELCRCERCGAAMTAIVTADVVQAGLVPPRGDHPDLAGAHSDALHEHPVEAPATAARSSAGGGARVLRCLVDGLERPEVCGHCGATRLAVLRAGISRIREELEALVGEAVEEVTGATANRGSPPAAGTDVPGVPVSRVVVGTSAVLHRVHRADRVIFLDLDQELLAPRYRAGSQALTQLALASRVLGGRARGGRLVVQTRQPDHEVLEAVLHADPDRWLVPELQRRADLQLPPTRALALLEGDGAAAFVAALGTVNVSGSEQDRDRITVLGPTRGRYLLRATNHTTLSAALASVDRSDPTQLVGKLKILVDPPGI